MGGGRSHRISHGRSDIPWEEKSHGKVEYMPWEAPQETQHTASHGQSHGKSHGKHDASRECNTSHGKSLGNSHGILWEVSFISWESYGTDIESHRKHHGKIPWDTRFEVNALHGIHSTPNGISWDPMAMFIRYGARWAFPSETLWDSHEVSHGIPWNIAYELPWESLWGGPQDRMGRPMGSLMGNVIWDTAYELPWESPWGHPQGPMGRPLGSPMGNVICRGKSQGKSHGIYV